MKRVLQLGLTLTLALFALIILTGDSGYLSYRAAQARYQDLLEEARKLKAENLALIREIELLKSDKEYQEYVLRREMNLIRKDEILLLFDGPRETR